MNREKKLELRVLLREVMSHDLGADNPTPIPVELRTKLQEAYTELGTEVDQGTVFVALDTFSEAMRAALVKAESEGRFGWSRMSRTELYENLIDQLTKGNTVNAANYLMFMHHRGYTTLDVRPTR